MRQHLLRGEIFWLFYFIDVKRDKHEILLCSTDPSRTVLCFCCNQWGHHDAYLRWWDLSELSSVQQDEYSSAQVDNFSRCRADCWLVWRDCTVLLPTSDKSWVQKTVINANLVNILMMTNFPNHQLVFCRKSRENVSQRQGAGFMTQLMGFVRNFHIHHAVAAMQTTLRLRSSATFTAGREIRSGKMFMTESLDYTGETATRTTTITSKVA